MNNFKFIVAALTVITIAIFALSPYSKDFKHIYVTANTSGFNVNIETNTNSNNDK